MGIFVRKVKDVSYKKVDMGDPLSMQYDHQAKCWLIPGEVAPPSAITGPPPSHWCTGSRDVQEVQPQAHMTDDTTSGGGLGMPAHQSPEDSQPKQRQCARHGYEEGRWEYTDAGHSSYSSGAFLPGEGCPSANSSHAAPAAAEEGLCASVWGGEESVDESTVCEMSAQLQQGKLPSPWVPFDYVRWSAAAWSLLFEASPGLYAWHYCQFCGHQGWGDAEWAAFAEQDPQQMQLLEYHRALWHAQPPVLPLPREGEPLADGGVATSDWLASAHASFSAPQEVTEAGPSDITVDAEAVSGPDASWAEGGWGTSSQASPTTPDAPSWGDQGPAWGEGGQASQEEKFTEETPMPAFFDAVTAGAGLGGGLEELRVERAKVARLERDMTAARRDAASAKSMAAAARGEAGKMRADIATLASTVAALQDVAANAAAGAQAAIENSQAATKASATTAAELARTQATVKGLQANLAAATDAAAAATARAAAAEADLGEALLALGMHDEVQEALAAAVDTLGGDGAAVVREMEARHTADALAGDASQATEGAPSRGVSTSGVSVASTDWGSDVSAVLRSTVGGWAAGEGVPAGDTADAPGSVSGHRVPQAACECQEEGTVAASPHSWSPADCGKVVECAKGGGVSCAEGVGYAGYPVASAERTTPALETMPGAVATAVVPAGVAPAVGVATKAAVGRGWGGGGAPPSAPRSPLAQAPFTPRRCAVERAAAQGPGRHSEYGASGVASCGNTMV